MQALFDIVADLDTPVSTYLKLAPLRPRYLLESVEGGTQLGRYSFLGFGAAREIRLDDGRGVIVGHIALLRPQAAEDGAAARAAWRRPRRR